MTEEEWQDAVRRRDEIIDANKGIELDFLYADALPLPPNIELMGDILQTVANAPKDDLPVLQSKIRDLFSHATKLEIKGE